MPTEVVLVPRPIDRWRDILATDRWTGFQDSVHLAQAVCNRQFWCVNSTAAGGGVAEMLRTLLSYLTGVGIPARWAVIDGDTQFFAITKRLHNFIHGEPGDGGPLGWEERNSYHRMTHTNACALLEMIPTGSLVVLHDPQTAGLIEPLRRHGCTVIWRCHIGAEQTNQYTEQAWAFLEPFVAHADRLVFSRASHIPAELSGRPVTMITPSIDPFAPKNQRLNGMQIHAILAAAGLIDPDETAAQAEFYRLNGQTSTVTGRATVLGGGGIDLTAPIVLQVSRWDRLKDHAGVMRGFLSSGVDGQLVLAGPHAGEVADDPEGADVLRDLSAQHSKLPAADRARVHIVSLPMVDVEENAVIVNALQRAATVVVQKSLQEGFGLTVTEALWKSKPLIASRVGGICDQVVDGQTGILLDDPTDEAAFGAALATLLGDKQRGDELGTAAATDVYDRFLHDKHIRRWLRLFASI